LKAALAKWTAKLQILTSAEDYTHDSFTGDFFDRSNPVWKDVGILQTTKSGAETVSNTRQTRDQAGQLLTQRVGK
jgi:hypothetical protein